MSGNPISRRDFIKLVGFGAATIGLGVFVKFGSLKELNRLIPRSASAQSAGSWAIGPNTTVVAIHAALLPSNKIFYLAGSGYHIGQENGPFESGILDLNTGSQQTSQQSEDLFCVGLAGLPNGNVLLAGGTKIYDTDINNCNGFWHGLNAGYRVDGSSGAAAKVSSMAHGRWYPTCVTLADGKVLVVNGYDEYGIYNLLTEIYDPSSDSWSISSDPNSNITYCAGASQETACPGAGSPCYGNSAPNVGLYPKMHLMPSGLVITCGPTVTVRSWNPVTEIWNIITQTSSYRDYGTSFLLPLNNTASERGKIMIVGGNPTATDPALRTVQVLDFNAGSSTNPVVRTVGSISYARKFLLPIILPTGKCVIFAGFAPDQGGVTGNYTNIPEMFDPVTETWSDLPAATVQRGYHGVALLLPDGRVWTASDTASRTDFELRTEIFSPSYYSQTRPTISGTPNVGNYGGTIGIPTPDAPNITKVSLVRLMATTHHYDPNARLLWLQILGSNSNNVTVSAPLNGNLAPPGYYMIHVLNSSGVPSVAKIIQIPGTGSDPSPAQVAGLTVTPVSSSQLNLAWSANTEPDLQRYNVYRGTIAGFPVTLGTTMPVAQPTTNSLSNTGLNPSTTYYYKVSAVDTAGNIGPLSAERSGTTLTNTVFYDVAIPGNSEGNLSSNQQQRYGEEANTASSILVGKSLKSWKVRLRKTGSPSGNVTARIRRRSDDAVVATFEQVIASTTLPTTLTEFTFTLTNPYTIQTGDRILIEYNGPPSVRVESWNVDMIGGSNTRRISYKGSYATSNTEDIAGTMSSLIGGDSTPPAQVAGLMVTPVSSTQLNLAWTANTEPDLNHYNVYRGTIAGFPVTLGTTVPTFTPITNSISDTGLSPSTTYYYKVAAVDNFGNIGLLSTEGSATTNSGADITPPAQVAGLMVTPVSSTQLNLAWTANTEPDLNHYNVYRGTSPGFPVTLGTTVPTATPTANSFSNSGLSPSTTYYYKVAAVDNSGNIGLLSTEGSGTTQIVQSYSILFDGVDDLINCTNDATLWSQSLAKFSFSFWINLSSINLTNRTLVQHGYPSNQSFLCHRDNGNGEVIWFRIRNTAGTDVLAGIASSPSLLNRWAHITCVYDNSLGSANLKIYEDGILGGTTGNLTQAINLSTALTLDGAVAGFQAGKIKDFRWWTTRALTNTEINDVRANLPTAPTPNYWLKMEEGSGNPIDSISGTKVGTLVGGASWSTG
jgi:fibronectin type 3 domain-containing protein